MKSLVFWGVAPAVLAAVCGSACSVSADEVRIVAKPGDSVRIPNDPNAYTISHIYTATGGLAIPSASSGGSVVFLGQIAGPGVGSMNSQCVLRATPGTSGFAVDSIARRGSTSPMFSYFGITSAAFSTFGNPSVNDYGCIYFPATVTGTGITAGVNSSGYWGAGPSGSAFPVLQDRMSAVSSDTSSSSVTYSIGTFTDVVMAKSSRNLMLTFGSNVLGATTGGPTRLLGRAANSGAELLAAPNTQTLDLAGITFSSDVQRVQGEFGQAVVFGSISGSSVTASNNQCIWAAPAADRDSLILVARTGSAAPGMSGWTYTNFLGNAGTKPCVTNQGTVLYSGRATNTAGAIDYGLWMGGPSVSTPTLLARGSQAAPGAGAGATMGILFSPTGVRSVFGGDAGSTGARSPVAFMSSMLGGSVTSNDCRALWRMPCSGNSTPLMLGRGGYQAPDAESGAVFVNSTFGNIMTGNHGGDVAMFVQLQGASITDANDYAYYISRGNSLHLAVREGQEIPNSNGMRVVSLVTQPQMYLNEAGHLVVFASVSNDPTGASSQFAYLGVDEQGGVRILAMPGLTVHPTNGPDCTLGGLSLNATSCLTNDGDFVFGAIVTGAQGISDAVFSIHISPLPTTSPCPADWNHNGEVSEQDVYDFLTDYFAGRADFNQDGVMSVMDLFDFIRAWFRGC